LIQLSTQKAEVVTALMSILAVFQRLLLAYSRGINSPGFTAMGKLDKKVLRAPYWGAEGRAVG
jgi:hypothetical protein